MGPVLRKRKKMVGTARDYIIVKIVEKGSGYVRVNEPPLGRCYILHLSYPSIRDAVCLSLLQPEGKDWYKYKQ